VCARREKVDPGPMNYKAEEGGKLDYTKKKKTVRRNRTRGPRCRCESRGTRRREEAGGGRGLFQLRQSRSSRRGQNAI